MTPCCSPARLRICLLITCCACLGCGSTEPFDYIKVRGSVSYEDGSSIPAGGMRLVFTSLDTDQVGRFYPRPATADVNGQGKFDVVTSHKYGDGLVPGRHRVAILHAKDKHGTLLVPKEYTNVSTTPLVIEVHDSSPLDIRFPRPDASSEAKTGSGSSTTQSEP